MKRFLRVTAIMLTAFALLISTPTLSAQEADADWKSLKTESKRVKIDEMSAAAIETVMNGNWKAEELFETAYGWAAFDNLKIAFLLSGGGGNGVAIKKESGETYLHEDGHRRDRPRYRRPVLPGGLLLPGRKDLSSISSRRAGRPTPRPRPPRARTAPTPPPALSTASPSGRSPTRASWPRPTSRERSTGRIKS